MTIARYKIVCTEFKTEAEVGVLRPDIRDERYWEIMFTPEFSRYIGYRSFVGSFGACVCILQSLFKGCLRKY